MGLLSSSKSASTAIPQNAAFSEIAGNATSVNVAGMGSGSQTVNLLDGSAIAKSFSFASDALEQSLKQVELAGSTTKATVSEAVRAVSESARAETENIVIQVAKWAAIAAIAWAGFMALRSFKG